MIDTDANGAQPKAHRCDAARCIARSSVLDQSVSGIGLFPKVFEGSVLDSVEKRVGGNLGGRWNDDNRRYQKQ